MGHPHHIMINANDMGHAAGNNSSESGTASLKPPPYTINSTPPNGEEGNNNKHSPNMTYVDPSMHYTPYEEKNYSSMEEGDVSQKSKKKTHTKPIPSAKTTLKNLNFSDLKPQLFTNLIHGTIGKPGSLSQMSLRLGFGVGTTIIFADAFGGMILDLSGKIENDEKGKLKIEGGIGFGGYVKAEAVEMFGLDAELILTKKIEGEFDSVQHFANYIYAFVLNSAKSIVSMMQQHMSDKHIPLVLLRIANNKVVSSRSPEITKTKELKGAAKAKAGTDDNGIAMGGSYATSEFTKTRNDKITEKGTQRAIEGFKSVTIGKRTASISMKNTFTDSNVDKNDKEEFEINLGFSSVPNQIDDNACKELKNLINFTTNNVTKLAEMTHTVGISMLKLINGRSLFSGKQRILDISKNAVGTLNVKIKLVRQQDGYYKNDFFKVNYCYDLDVDASVKAPIAGTNIIGEGTAALNGKFDKNIYLHNFN